MGVFAWLMLVINSLAAPPMSMIDGAHAQVMHATAAASEQSPHRLATERSCCDDRVAACGDATGFTCHCVAMCSTALPTAGVAIPTPIATTARYAVLLPDSAPLLDTAPPLRPPAA